MFKTLKIEIIAQEQHNKPSIVRVEKMVNQKGEEVFD